MVTIILQNGKITNSWKEITDNVELTPKTGARFDFNKRLITNIFTE